MPGVVTPSPTADGRASAAGSAQPRTQSTAGSSELCVLLQPQPEPLGQIYLLCARDVL